MLYALASFARRWSSLQWVRKQRRASLLWSQSAGWASQKRLQKLSCGCVRTLRRLSLAMRCQWTVAWSHSNWGMRNEGYPLVNPIGPCVDARAVRPAARQRRRPRGNRSAPLLERRPGEEGNPRLRAGDHDGGEPEVRPA